MADVFYEGRDLEVLADMPRYYDWIFSYFDPYLRGDAIEYGAGIGTVAERIRPHVDRLELIEPSENLIPILERRFDHDDAVTVSRCFLEEHVAAAASDSVDTIVLINVLEHIEDDGAALAELLRILRHGGHVLVFVPALSRLMSKFDGLVGHHRRYDLPMLRALAERQDAQIVLAKYFDALGIAPWLLFNTWLGKTNLDPLMLRIYDRTLVPIGRVIESYIEPLAGKNIVAILRKAGH